MPIPPLRVATYNIHGCVGTDRCFDPARIQGVLAHLAADILALQEVETYHHGEDVLGTYQQDPQWQVIAGPTLLREQGQYGNALITRLPVLDYALIDLSVASREARSAIHAVLAHEGARLQVVATHLGLRPAERRHQVRTLLEALQRSDTQADASLLLGDFNEWFLAGRPLRWLHRHFGRGVSMPPTFPSRWPLFRLDRIWASAPARLTDVRVLRTAQSRCASDHLPLLGELRF
ncbi:MAG: endonuclease/exonuclease/phosphatase family protein [Candidatus Macondimonas sp.]